MAAMQQARLVADAVGRKAWMISRRLPRTAHRVTADDQDYVRRPPVVVTTVPKSGTHLVHQAVTALPGTVDYGTFVATTVSWRRRPRSAEALVRRIRALAPGEIVRAHLVHRPEIVDALRAKQAFVVFVCRDPRDVIVSEAHYIANAAPWHSLHRAFARLSPEQRIDLAIGGLPGFEALYPDVGKRFGWYEGWLDDADVVLRFEDLMGGGRQEAIDELVRRYDDASDLPLDVAAVAGRAAAAIDPARSHTFREGRVGAWREAFSPEQVAAFDHLAGSKLHRYGYVPPPRGNDAAAMSGER